MQKHIIKAIGSGEQKKIPLESSAFHIGMRTLVMVAPELRLVLFYWDDLI